MIHFIARCTERPPQVVEMIQDLQGLYKEDGLRPPTTEREITSAVLNGWGYASDPAAPGPCHAQSHCDPSGNTQPTLDMPHSHNDIKHMPQSHNSNSHSVKLISKSLPANQLCNIICHKLHIHRDTSIQDTIILRQQLRKEKLALARIKRAETY